MPRRDSKRAARAMEYREEAARLSELPEEEQAAVIAWLEAIASDNKLKNADRKIAAERARNVKRLLQAAKKGRKGG